MIHQPQQFWHLFRFRSQASLSAESKHATCTVRLNYRATIHAASWPTIFIGSLNTKRFLFTALARSGNQSRVVVGVTTMLPSSSLLFRNSKAFVHAAANRWRIPTNRNTTLALLVVIHRCISVKRWHSHVVPDGAVVVDPVHHFSCYIWPGTRGFGLMPKDRGSS